MCSGWIQLCYSMKADKTFLAELTFKKKYILKTFFNKKFVNGFYLDASKNFVSLET